MSLICIPKAPLGKVSVKKVEELGIPKNLIGKLMKE